LRGAEKADRTVGRMVEQDRVTPACWRASIRQDTLRIQSQSGRASSRGIQSLFGGNITIYTEFAEKAREEAYGLMVKHATALGANAVVAMRYDANEITEVLAYGTAVVIQQA
jgi:uncharacterized protein YbjQ (UPF0145 family)